MDSSPRPPTMDSSPRLTQRFSWRTDALVKKVEALTVAVSRRTKFVGWLLTEFSAIFCFTIWVFASAIVWQHHSLEKLEQQRPDFIVAADGSRLHAWGGVPRGGDGCPAGLRRRVECDYDDNTTSWLEVSDCYECPRANRYWARVLTPTLEFGLMHAIMLQMGALPLTMCHHTLKLLSRVDALQRLLPFHRVQKLHIFIGYFITIMLTLAVGGFLTFFGFLCRDSRNGGSHFKPPLFENEHDCQKFETEIFITGMIIFAMTLVIASAAYLRARIPYWVFVTSHQLVFVWFAVAIAHTVDDQQRTNHREPRKSDNAAEPETLKRSQVWPWCLASLTLHWIDRFYLSTEQRFADCQILKATLRQSEHARSIELSVSASSSRRTQMRWRPGQHFLLRDSKISPIFHPFSCCGSGDDEDAIKFLMKVRGPNSWTATLYDRLADLNPPKPEDFDADSGQLKCAAKKIEVEPRTSFDAAITLQGPLGTPPDFTQDFDHVILIGSGTGAVPCLSVVDDVATCLSQQVGAGAYTQTTTSPRTSESNRRHALLEKALGKQRHAVYLYGGVLRALAISALSLFQFVVAGLEISWYVLGVQQENSYVGDRYLRQLWRCNLAAQVFFGVVVADDVVRKKTTAVHKKLLFSDLLDLALALAGFAAEFRWNGGKPLWRRGSPDVAGRAALAGLRFLRLWARNLLVQNAPKNAGFTKHTKYLWGSPVKSLSACILAPDTESCEWLLPTVAAAQLRTEDKLQAAGHPARDDFNLDLFLTRADAEQAAQDCSGVLDEDLQRYRYEHVFAGFPDLLRLVHDRMVKSAAQESSTTCIFFCGPATLGEQIQEIVYRAQVLFGDADHTLLYYDDIYVKDTRRARRDALQRGTIKQRSVTQRAKKLRNGISAKLAANLSFQRRLSTTSDTDSDDVLQVVLDDEGNKLAPTIVFAADSFAEGESANADEKKDV